MTTQFQVESDVLACTSNFTPTFECCIQCIYVCIDVWFCTMHFCIYIYNVKVWTTIDRCAHKVDRELYGSSLFMQTTISVCFIEHDVDIHLDMCTVAWESFTIVNCALTSKANNYRKAQSWELKKKWCIRQFVFNFRI